MPYREVRKPFLVHFSETVTPIKVRDKESSLLMQIIAWALSVLTKMKVVDFSKERFMNDYITTIGSTIYVGKDRGWSMDMEVTPVVLHELTHVLQFLRTWMELQYLISDKWRSYFESTADQAWMIVWPGRATDEYLDRKVESFVFYGIPADMIREDLKERRTEVLESRPQPEARRVADCYIEWDHGIYQ